MSTDHRTGAVTPPRPARPEQPVPTAGQGTTAAAVGLFAGFAGFGAGSVNLAIASSLLLSPSGGPGVAGIVTALWGSALLLWTVLALQRGRILWARPALALLLAAAVAHGVATVAGSAIGPAGLAVSQLTALLLTLMIVGATAWLDRRPVGGSARSAGTDAPDAADAPRAGRLLGIAFGCAVLVAGVATPGLAASTAGQFAVPHGEHAVPGSGSPHGH